MNKGLLVHSVAKELKHYCLRYKLPIELEDDSMVSVTSTTLSRDQGLKWGLETEF